MRRILVTGAPGSGKSTTARKLGAILGLPVVHMDLLHWNPGWVETPREEFHRRLHEELHKDAWIVDGNYGGTMDVRMAHADAMIFLDLPRRVYLRRVLMRPSTPRPDIPPDCPERRFSREYWEFIVWTWNYPTRSRPAVLERIERHRDHMTIYRLESQAAVDRFLEGLRRARSCT